MTPAESIAAAQRRLSNAGNHLDQMGAVTTTQVSDPELQEAEQRHADRIRESHAQAAEDSVAKALQGLQETYPRLFQPATPPQPPAPPQG